MSEAHADEVPFPKFPPQQPRPTANNRGARRVTIEEKLRQEQEMGFQGRACRYIVYLHAFPTHSVT